MNDERRSLESGLIAGREYAARASDTAPASRAAQSRNAEDTRSAIDWSLIKAPDRERPVAFWSGFVHGVREFLVSDQAATPPERPESDGT